VHIVPPPPCQAIAAGSNAAPRIVAGMNSPSCYDSYLASPDTLRYVLSIKGGLKVPETIEIQLKKGVLTLCVLALLNRHDGYAYEIASTLLMRSTWARGPSTR